MATLLVPLDFSTGTHRHVEAAAELAAALGDSLHLLHVIEPASAYVPVGASMDVITPPPVDLPSLDSTAQTQRMEELAAPLRNRGLSVQVTALPGLPLEEILQQAEVVQPRYIVLASHGHGALYHLFSGSVVTGVLKQAKQPVLVVPVKAMEEASPAE
jgi:nucleotide-binding universal stress UspA family protein